MKCVIMQPTYLPWAGYFNLISQANVFVFLDNVQYEKRSWQNRNRVLINGLPHWITVPARRLSQSQRINTVEVDDSQKWRSKHIRLLNRVYAKHPFVQQVLDAVQEITDTSITYLAELNIRLIMTISAGLGLSPAFYRSSELNINGQRSERLLKICEYFSCDEYLSPVGSADYLAMDGVFDHAPIRLLFQEFKPRFYLQKGATEFVSHLSVVDALANLGWEQTSQYVRG